MSFLHQGRFRQSHDEAIALSTTKRSKLRNEVELLLSVLLENASLSDASLVLDSIHTANQGAVLSWLYNWMGNHTSSTQAYKSFALAMKHNHGIHDVDPDLEIRFSNRATMLSGDPGVVDEEL
jgi:hypothetical protein